MTETKTPYTVSKDSATGPAQPDSHCLDCGAGWPYDRRGQQCEHCHGPIRDGAPLPGGQIGPHPGRSGCTPPACAPDVEHLLYLLEQMRRQRDEARCEAAHWFRGWQELARLSGEVILDLEAQLDAAEVRLGSAERQLDRALAERDDARYWAWLFCRRARLWRDNARTWYARSQQKKEASDGK